MPNHPGSNLLMICTGTGSAPMRAMTERRRRRIAQKEGGELMLFFGARTPEELPYFGPLMKLPQRLHRHQLRVLARAGRAEAATCRTGSASAPPTSRGCSPTRTAYIYVCGLKGMEEGVDAGVPRRVPRARVDWDSAFPSCGSRAATHLETY